MKKRRKKKKKNRKHCVSGPYIRGIRFPSVTGNNNMFIKILSFLLSFKVLEMRKTPLFAARYYLHYLHSFTFIHIPSLQTSNIFCFFQSLHNFSLTQFSSCLSSIQFSSANSFNILSSTSLTSTSS